VSNKDKSRCRIIGIDPGLDTTGYAVVDFAPQADIIEAGTIQTAVSGNLQDRIAQIYDDLTEILIELTPDIAAVEKLYSHYRHPRTAILMGHARGAILLACAEREIPVWDLPATMVKRSLTGNGRASKQQVQRAVASICNLPEPPSPPDVADALAIALCTAKRLENPLKGIKSR